jgi:glucan phosphoethanolaminetransferase (alkaline phosphatase superfamily)
MEFTKRRNMFAAGWIAIILEILLLLLWVYDVFFSRNETDPAGKGTAIPFLLGLVAYIVVGILLMLVHRNWSTIAVLVMAVLTLGIVIIGLRKQYEPGR